LRPELLAQPRLRGRRAFRSAQGTPGPELDARGPFGRHLLAQQRVQLERLRGRPSFRGGRSELENRQRLDAGLEQRFHSAFYLGWGAAAEHIRESFADLTEVPARERGGRVREHVRRTRVVTDPPPHL